MNKEEYLSILAKRSYESNKRRIMKEKVNKKIIKFDWDASEDTTRPQEANE